jgi:hypothetical protein
LLEGVNGGRAAATPRPAFYVAIAHLVGRSCHAGRSPLALFEVVVAPIHAARTVRLADAWLFGEVAPIRADLAHQSTQSTLRLYRNFEARLEKHVQSGDALLTERYAVGLRAAISILQYQPGSALLLRANRGGIPTLKR